MASQATAVMDERVVQTWALHYLHSRYAKANPGKRIFADVEMLLKKQYEGKKGYDRVDGLICINKETNYYSIAIEAKSMKTAYSLLTSAKEGSIFQNALISALLVIPVLLTVFLFWFLAWYWLVLLVGGVLLLSLLAVGFYNESPHLLTTGVHEQLGRYAGNEKWLALPEDVRFRLTASKQWNKFLKICKLSGFGLLTVSTDGFVNEWQSPKQVKGDFIRLYKKEQEIKNYLDGKPSLLTNYSNCLSFKDKLQSIVCKNPQSRVTAPQI
ncbi:hypothetical protein GCM10023172_02770 [Hymenobacter ginsengisoli]|uniref:YcxB-like protein domain-containing protein n=1 Tax=Hymenobacter ginsengisoli TaxID=1051626 RepID=A0ABP8PWM8_9BACT|nr:MULTISPECIES: hypothetical protein [unclassified Hymenobacter]MBO2030380.1 hypothetical protein [Hymenobacter sp. BT559]